MTSSSKPALSVKDVGEALYGERWVAQLTRELKNKHGEPLSQSTLKSMRDYGILPDYIKAQLPVIIQRRRKELQELNDSLFSQEE